MPARHGRSRRDVLCAAMIATFAVTAATGVLMFFHLARASVAVAHEWFGLAFLGLIGWHMVRNWPALRAYCRRPMFVGSVFLALAFGVIVTAVTESEPRGRGLRAEPADPPISTHLAGVAATAEADQAPAPAADRKAATNGWACWLTSDALCPGLYSADPNPKPFAPAAR